MCHAHTLLILLRFSSQPPLSISTAKPTSFQTTLPTHLSEMPLHALHYYYRFS